MEPFGAPSFDTKGYYSMTDQIPFNKIPLKAIILGTLLGVAFWLTIALGAWGLFYWWKGC
jgi:hypothetical protein